MPNPSWIDKHYPLEGPLQVGAALGSLPFGGFTTLYRDLAKIGAPGTTGHISTLRVSPTRHKGERAVVTAHEPRVGIEHNRALYGGRHPSVTGHAPVAPRARSNAEYLYSSGNPAVAQAYRSNAGTYTGPTTRPGVIQHLPPPAHTGSAASHSPLPSADTTTNPTVGGTPPPVSPSDIGSTIGPDLARILEVGAVALVAIVLVMVVAKSKRKRR